MYQLGYRCDVTGATLSRPLPKRKSCYNATWNETDIQPCYHESATTPTMSVIVLWEPNSLITGSKQSVSHINVFGATDSIGETITCKDSMILLSVSALYIKSAKLMSDNHEMGFMDGAQTDLFAGVPAESSPAPAPSSSTATPSLAASTSVTVSAPTASSDTPTSTQETSIAAEETQSASPASSSTSLAAANTTSQSSAVQSSASSLSPNNAASSAASAISAVVSTAAAAPSKSASAAGRCKRRRRRSMDVQRHRARNRTLGLRHTTALAA